MKNKSLDIAGFLRLAIEALNAARVDYLIGGAIAEWARGEPRATQDWDLVVNIPIKSVNKLSKELEKRDMLIPAEIILDSVLEDRAEIPIKSIQMHSGLKAHFNGEYRWITVPQLERCISIRQRISFFTSSCTLG